MAGSRFLAATATCATLLTAAPAWASADVPAGLAYLPSLLAPACAPVPYEPLPVYDFPGGVRSGQLVLDKPEWAKPAPREPNEPCLQAPQLHVQLEGQKSLVPAPVLKVRDEPTLVVQEVQTGPEGVWLKFESNKKRFWLPLARGVLFKSLERDLVQGLGLLNEVCDSLGECRPTSPAQRRLADDAALTRSPNCPLPAYLVEGITQLPTGRRVYQVRLAPELWPQFAHQLPVQALVPVRGFDGQWSGMFNPQPCAQPKAPAPGAPEAESSENAGLPALQAGAGADTKAPESDNALHPPGLQGPAGQTDARRPAPAPLRHLPPLPTKASGMPSVPAGLGLPALIPPPALPGSNRQGDILEFTPER